MLLIENAKYIGKNNKDFTNGLYYNITICKPDEEIPGYKNSGKHYSYNPDRVYILNNINNMVWIWGSYDVFFYNWEF